MQLRVVRWMAEARLLLALILEAVLLGRVTFWMLYFTPFFLLYEWKAGDGLWSLPVALYALIWCAAVVWRLWPAEDEETSTEPLAATLDDAAVLQLCRKVEGELRCRIPTDVRLALAPEPWKQYGCSAWLGAESARSLTIPLGCLAIWSVMDFGYYLGHRAVCRRLSGWLFRKARRTMRRLEVEHFQAAAQKLDDRRARMLENLASAISSRQAMLHMMAEMEADRRLAEVYGTAAVSAWVQRTALAPLAVSGGLSGVVEPALEHGSLLPVAEVGRIWHRQMEPVWAAELSSQMRSAEQAGAITGMSIAAIRLAALQPDGRGAGVVDPRAATSLFAGLEALEEAALRNEVAGVRVALRRIGVEELATELVLPQMREELARNGELLAAYRIEDLPDLVARRGELAERYAVDPQYLLAKSQREAMIPHLLAAFLAIELTRRGWCACYTVQRGILLQNGEREVQPVDTVAQLTSGELTAAEYRARIASS